MRIEKVLNYNVCFIDKSRTLADELRDFESILGFKPRQNNVYNCLYLNNKNFTTHGFFWFYNDTDTEIVIARIKNKMIVDNSRAIAELDKSGNIVHIYRNATEAAKENNINIHNLCSYLRGDKYKYGNKITVRKHICGKSFAYVDFDKYLENCFKSKPSSGKNRKITVDGKSYNSLSEFQNANGFGNGYGCFLAGKVDKNPNATSEMKFRKYGQLHNSNVIIAPKKSPSKCKIIEESKNDLFER